MRTKFEKSHHIGGFSLSACVIDPDLFDRSDRDDMGRHDPLARLVHERPMKYCGISERFEKLIEDLLIDFQRRAVGEMQDKFHAYDLQS